MRAFRLSRLLAPALLAVSALALSGCAPAAEKAPTASSSSPKPSSWEEHNEARAGESEAKVSFEEGDSDCPEGIRGEQGTFDENSTFEVIGTGEFMAKAIGADVLKGACVVRSTIVANQTQSVYDYAYVPGDGETVEQITASLTADGFKPEGGDLFVNNEQVFVTTWLADTEEDKIEMAKSGIEFDSVVLVLAWQDTPAP